MNIKYSCRVRFCLSVLMQSRQFVGFFPFLSITSLLWTLDSLSLFFLKGDNDKCFVMNIKCSCRVRDGVHVIQDTPTSYSLRGNSKTSLIHNNNTGYQNDRYGRVSLLGLILYRLQVSGHRRVLNFITGPIADIWPNIRLDTGYKNRSGIQPIIII